MEEKRSWWSAYAEHYELLDIPVLLAAQDAALCWANAAARGLGLDYAYSHAIRREIFLAGNSTFYDKIQENSTVRLPLDELLERGGDFCLSAVDSPEGRLGFAVTVKPRTEVPEADYYKGAERCISTFTHQMRSPISSIFSAVAGVLRNNDAEYGDPEIREYASAITVGSYRLLRTSMHVAQFYRYKYGSVVFQPHLQDLNQFLEQLCRMISVMIEAQVPHFSYQMPQEPVPARFDAPAITMAVLELISNAVKFIGENGEISVALQMGGETAVISVTDNGLGMADGLVNAAFEPYFSHDPRTGGICGDGLGLWLCRESVRLHGGSVALESREGGGTRVVFSLPLGQGEPGAQFMVRDFAGDYLYDRFSDVYVILSDVCKVPEP